MASGHHIIGYGSSPSQHGPVQHACWRWPTMRSPGSRTWSVRTCQVLRPRRVAQALALALLDILPSATQTASAPGISFLSRLNGWPARSPADASPTSLRLPAHGSGPMWVASPSSWGTFTSYSLPVSRRTDVSIPMRIIWSTDGLLCLRSATTSFWHSDAVRGPSTPTALADALYQT